MHICNLLCPLPICAGAVSCSLFHCVEEKAGSWLLCVQPVWCMRITERGTPGKASAPAQCEMHTGSSCLKQLQLLPWQTTFPPFLLRNRASSDVHLPNLHLEKVKHWAARPHPWRGSGTRDGMDRRQFPELTARTLWAGFSPFCLQRWRSKRSVFIQLAAETCGCLCSLFSQ